MKLPEKIEAEIVRSRVQLGHYYDRVDGNGNSHSYGVTTRDSEDFARRIARLVAEDCAGAVKTEGLKQDATGVSDDYFGLGMEAGAEVIRERYGLKENDDD